MDVACGLADAGGDFGRAGTAAALVGERQAADRTGGVRARGTGGFGGAGDGHELNAKVVHLGWALVYRPGNDPDPQPKYDSPKG